MSSLANWSYTNTIRVRPFLSMDGMTQSSTYGPEYEIACGWIAKAEQMRADNGAEFVSRHIVYTEDARPKYLDLVQLPGIDGWQEVRSKTAWEMSAFGAGELTDFMLVT